VLTQYIPLHSHNFMLATAKYRPDTTTLKLFNPLHTNTTHHRNRLNEAERHQHGGNHPRGKSCCIHSPGCIFDLMRSSGPCRCKSIELVLTSKHTSIRFQRSRHCVYALDLAPGHSAISTSSRSSLSAQSKSSLSSQYGKRLPPYGRGSTNATS